MRKRIFDDKHLNAIRWFVQRGYSDGYISAVFLTERSNIRYLRVRMGMAPNFKPVRVPESRRKQAVTGYGPSSVNVKILFEEGIFQKETLDGLETTQRDN